MQIDEASTSAGAPPRPEAEDTSRHDRREAGEESREQCSATSSSSDDPFTAPEVDASSVRTIVRASCKIKVDTKMMSDEEKKRFYGAVDPHLQLVAKTMNALVRKLWREDGETLDKLPPKAKLTKTTWPISISMTDAYHFFRKMAPTLPSLMAATISREVYKKWSQERFDALVRCVKKPPHYTCPPMPFPGQSTKVYEDSINCQMTSGTGSRLDIPLFIRDDWQRNIMSKLASGEWRHGEVELSRDSQRPWIWYVRISYKRRVDAIPPAERTAAINRGIRCFLSVVTYEGEDLVYSGADIVEHLQRMRARRQKIQRCYPVSGRKGRGVKKALKPLKPLQDATKKWRQTRSQTIAREVSRWLVKRKITTLYIEDFTGIRDNARERLNKEVGQLVQEWPYYELQQRIVACCEEAGLNVVQVHPRYISQTCPRCGHVDPDNRDLGRWQLKCVKCRYRRHLDVAAATNVLHRGERDGGDVLVGPKSLEKNWAKTREKQTARKAGKNGVRGKGTRRAR